MMQQTQDWVCPGCKTYGGLVICGKSLVDIIYKIIGQHNQMPGHCDNAHQIILCDDYTQHEVFKTRMKEIEEEYEKRHAAITV